MKLGRLDVCLRVQSVERSAQFYHCLGFGSVEGRAEEGWTVLELNDVRIGLFEPQYMQSDHSLNFRGAHLGEVDEALRAAGFSPERAAYDASVGTGSLTIRDPDGHILFFDTAPHELLQD